MYTTGTHPSTTEHLACEVHADGSDHTGLAAEETMVEKGDLHEELGQRTGLNVIVVCL
jgi:hypothetical protein